MLSLLTGWALGVVLGMRHALEPDHLAAVSTMVTDRSGSRTTGSAALLGAMWGLGHTLALLLAGGVLLALRTEMPDGLADLFELVVAVMLLFLGAKALRTAFLSMKHGPSAAHEHRFGHGEGSGFRHFARPAKAGAKVNPPGQRTFKSFRPAPRTQAVQSTPSHSHTHAAGPVAHLHLGPLTLARRPLYIGLLHGLAGSGALTALVLASMPSTLSAIVYMLLFGVGSLLGMAVLTGVVGLSLRKAATTHRAQALLVATAGSASVVMSIAFGVPLALRLWGRI